MTDIKYISRGNVNVSELEENNKNGFCKKGSCNKLNVHNWLKDVPDNDTLTDIVEVRFKNTRKLFFKNVIINI